MVVVGNCCIPALQNRICIISPDKNAYSETFIRAHIERLPEKVYFLYGGDFPLYEEDGEPLVRTKKTTDGYEGTIVLKVAFDLEPAEYVNCTRPVAWTGATARPRFCK